MHAKLACDHEVDVQVGIVVYNHYDAGLGIVERVGDDSFDNHPWHDVESWGSPYWKAGTRSLLDADRLFCHQCGLRDVARRGGINQGDGSWRLPEPDANPNESPETSVYRDDMLGLSIELADLVDGAKELEAAVAHTPIYADPGPRAVAHWQINQVIDLLCEVRHFVEVEAQDGVAR